MHNETTAEEAMRLLQRMAQEHAANDPPALSRFRLVCAVLCSVLAVVFLAINTLMLYRFGYRMGNDEEEKIAYALIAGAVPWALALLPFILMSTWVPARTVLVRGRLKRKRGRPSFAFFAAVALYILFVAVNFIGGVGVMATAREKVAGAADDARSEKTRLNQQRTRLNTELAGIAQHRPSEEVEALISRQQQHRFWRDTEQCSKREGAITGKGQRNFCSEYDLLLAELGRAKQGAKIRKDLDEVDIKLSSPARSLAAAEDAQIPTLARNFGVSEEKVRLTLPLMWPTMLELGSLMMVYFALKLFRISHDSLIDMPADSHIVPPTRQLPGPSQISRVLQAVDADDGHHTATQGPRSVIPEDPIRQRAVFDEFWRTRMRRVESGQVAESTVYSHYQVLCAQRSVNPFDAGTFRRLSAPHVRATVEIGGVQFWCHVSISE